MSPIQHPRVLRVAAPSNKRMERTPPRCALQCRSSARLVSQKTLRKADYRVSCHTLLATWTTQKMRSSASCSVLAVGIALLSGTARSESDNNEALLRLEMLAARDMTIADPAKQAHAWVEEFDLNHCALRIAERREFNEKGRNKWESGSAEPEKLAEAKQLTRRCLNIRSALSYYEKSRKID